MMMILTQWFEELPKMGRRKKNNGGGGSEDRVTRPAVARSEDEDDDAMWQRIHLLLTGLLSVELDARFQHEPTHANASWLVVHVTHVQDPEPQRRHLLPKLIGEALDCVAKLCVAAERVRQHEPTHLAFWTRVLTSQMMVRPLSSGDATIWWFAKHTREREIRVKVRWADRKLEKAMLAPLGAFLDAEVAGYSAGYGPLMPRRMAIALCVTKVNLTGKDMELLGQILVPSDGRRRRLFKDVISSLEISDAVLRVDALRTLAQKVYPTARRIDELRLEAIFPSGPLADPKVTLDKAYASAFKSVLVAALSDANGCGTHAVGISLASNPLDAVHLRGLYSALQGATRELSSLSLKYALLPPRGSINRQLSDGLVMALGHIIFQTKSPSGRDDVACELDLTGRTLQDRELIYLARSLHVAVEESIAAVRLALDGGRSVVCRASNFMLAGDDDRMMEADDDFIVVEVVETNYLRVVGLQADGLPGLEGYVPLSSVQELVIDGRAVVRSRFTRLILDGDVEGRLEGSVCGCEYKSLLSTIGRRATLVSMRWYRCPHSHSISDMIPSCRRLTHLSIEGSPSLFNNHTRWGLREDQCHRLESLNVGATQIYNDNVQRLFNQLLATPERRLKRLSLAQNRLSTASLQLVHQLLDVTPTLELVEIDSFGARDMDNYIEARRALTRDHEGVIASTRPMSGQAKLAFVSVVEKFCHQTALESSVYDRIFGFGELATRRHILWHQSR